MPQTYEFAPDPREYARQVLTQSERVLKRAVAIAFPETPELNPVLAFPKPNEVRDESPGIPELTDDRKAALFTEASELGFGKPENVTLSEQGLLNANVILEGGQPHKMLAEALMVVEDTDAKPKLIMLSAIPHRILKNADEINSSQRLFGQVGKTEYDVGKDVLNALPGFEAYDEPQVLDASYDINNDFATANEPTGQFKVMGQIGNTPVVLMQINRRDLDGDKYDRQPRTANVISIVDSVTKALGDTSSPIVHVTSGVYRPSRTIGVALAGLFAERPIGIATYGNDFLNKIKDDNAPPPLHQLPSELNVMARQVLQLKAALGIES